MERVYGWEAKLYPPHHPVLKQLHRLQVKSRINYTFKAIHCLPAKCHQQMNWCKNAAARSQDKRSQLLCGRGCWALCRLLDLCTRNSTVLWNEMICSVYIFSFSSYDIKIIPYSKCSSLKLDQLQLPWWQVNTPLWPCKHTSRPLWPQVLVPSSSMEAWLPWFPLRLLQRRKEEWVSVFLHQTHKPGDHVTLSSQLWFSLSSGNTGTTFTSDENDHIHELCIDLASYS